MNNKISIIVPIYKTEQYLERCVRSLVNQTFENIEIILVDDGSPDECPQLCDNYAQQDERIMVIHKKNGGLSEARNYGLIKASGEFILYVDSDDYLELNACEQLLTGINPNVDFVVGVLKENRDGKVIYQKHTNIIPRIEYSSKEFMIKSIKKNEWFAPAVLNLYRRSFLIENSLFYRQGYCYEDIEMLPRLYLAAKRIVYIDFPFYNYMIREESIMTSEFTEEKKAMAIDNYENWMNVLAEVDDASIKRYLSGILIRYYMTTAKKMNIDGWKVKGLDFKFAWKYSLNVREKLKIVLFNFFCEIYKII